jgi:hypothetical protein
VAGGTAEPAQAGRRLISIVTNVRGALNGPATVVHPGIPRFFTLSFDAVVPCLRAQRDLRAREPAPVYVAGRAEHPTREGHDAIQKTVRAARPIGRVLTCPGRSESIVSCIRFSSA